MDSFDFTLLISSVCFIVGMVIGYILRYGEKKDNQCGCDPEDE